MKKSNETVRSLFRITGAGGLKRGGEAHAVHVVPHESGVRPAKNPLVTTTPKYGMIKRRSAATRPLSPATASALKGLAEAIRNARKARKLTIEELAKRAGIAKKTMLAIEAGTGSTSTAALLEVISVLDSRLIETFVDALRADPVGKSLLDARLPERARPEKF